MPDQEVIILDKVSLYYSIIIRKKGKSYQRRIKALDNISLKVRFGESIGIIGENGSGKSTILKLIAGLIKPDAGNIEIKGRAAGVLELGAGFDRELTGRENIKLLANIYGFNKGEIAHVLDKIIDFADLGEFIDVPVKYYSSGMFIRLAFSIAIHLEPEVLLIDDTIAVGDEEFQRKCLEKINYYRKRGKTIVFVSHSLAYLENLTDRIILLKNGVLVKEGSAREVISYYLQTAGGSNYTLESDNIKLLFRKGRIYFLKDDIPITMEEGIYFSFVWDGKYIESFNLKWEIAERKENSLCFKNKEFNLSLEIRYDRENNFYIMINGTKGYGVEWRCFLTTGYQEWSSRSKNGSFDEFKTDIPGWQNIYHSEHDCQFLLKSKDEKLPSLYINSPLRLAIFDLFNAYFPLPSRIIRIKNFSISNDNPSAIISFKFLDNAENIRKKDDIEKNLEPAFLDGKPKIFWGKREIINNFVLKISDGKNWYNAIPYLHVKQRNDSEHEILWQFERESFQIKYIMILKFLAENEIFITIERILPASARIAIEAMDLFINPRYQKFFMQDYQGTFSNKFYELSFDQLQGISLSKSLLLTALDYDIPKLLFEKEQASLLMQLFNSSIFDHSRIVSFALSYPEDRILKSGREPVFGFKIKFFPQDVSAEQLIKPFSIGKGKLKIEFIKGQWIPRFSEIVFSRHWHFYSSLKYQDKWYDSTRTHTFIEHNTVDELHARLDWQELAISQFWSFKINDNIIVWKIELKFKDNIKIDSWQVNLMCSEQYKCWYYNDNGVIEGTFPPFRNVRDEWDRIAELSDDIEIGLKNRGNLPKLSFQKLQSSIIGKMAIVNSNSFFRARLLQWFVNDVKCAQIFIAMIKIGG